MPWTKVAIFIAGVLTGALGTLFTGAVLILSFHKQKMKIQQAQQLQDWGPPAPEK